MQYKKVRRGSGFTLIELMLTVSLTAIMAAWGGQAFYNILQQSRLTATSNHFLGVLEASRYRALASQLPVTVCASPDGTHCTRDRGQHILMFSDSNDNGLLDHGDLAIVSEELFGRGDFWLVWRDFRSTNYLRWASSGRTDNMNGTFTLCNSSRRESWLRQIVISKAGRVRLEYPGKAAGVVLQKARQRCGWP